jgi:hypothetical protein
MQYIARHLLMCSNFIQCRGFSDSLFGLSVVVAGIVMYDAQVPLSYSAIQPGFTLKLRLLFNYFS